MRTAFSFLAAALVAACSSPPQTPAPAPDAGASEQGSGGVDAGVDASAADADDAGPPDLGPPTDVGRDVGEPDEQLGPYPDPGAWPANRGPGGPATAFTEAQLDQHCAYLVGHEEDRDHHNLMVMWDGYLMMPWATDTGKGGLTFYEFDDPCSPTPVGSTYTPKMRETHSVGISQLGGAWMATNYIESLVEGGVLFWDVSDPTNPQPVSSFSVEDFFLVDAYKRVTQSVFWQVPYLYVGAAQNGIVVIDASDPMNPTHVTTWEAEPVAQIGQVQVIGDLLVASTAEGTRAFLLDVSDPNDVKPIPGGDFTVADSSGQAREMYFGNTTGGYAYLTRKEGGGSFFVYDIRDPSAPTFVGQADSPTGGAYVFVQDDLAFVGEGVRATIWDVADKAAPQLIKELSLVGDLDTMTPIGNVAVLSVDDDAEDDQASVVIPWRAEPDTTPPRVTWSVPTDGATNLRTTSRVGVTFSEFVDPKSAWEGSVRLYQSDLPPDEGRVAGYVSAQETIVNFWPKRELEPNTRYTFEIPAGGVTDYNGNAIEEPFRMEFETR